MTRSMTGYAAGTGAADGWSWAWDLRSVNGKGLDLRLRTPDWLPGLEAELRRRIQAQTARGTVSVSLRIGRDGAGEDGPDPAALRRLLAQVRAVEALAATEGQVLAPVRASDILSMRAGQEAIGAEEAAALRDRLIADFAGEVLPAFAEARAAEGRALDAILTARLDEIGALVARAGQAAEARRAGQGAALAAAVERIGAEVAVDPGRLAQELALLWVKQDVTEEIDRLGAHVAAARTLLAEDGPKGRKLDFLMQEFNREANTLCAKAQDSDLTALGLDLKTVIDQLREQVQNVE